MEEITKTNTDILRYRGAWLQISVRLDVTMTFKNEQRDIELYNFLRYGTIHMLSSSYL